MASLYLIWGFFSPTRLFQDSDGRKLGIGGVLAFTNIAMYLFEHSSYCLFPSAGIATTFRIATSLLGGIVVTLVATGAWPKAGKALLILSGIELVAVDLILCAVAHFNLRILSASIWRVVDLDSLPLGTAISAVIYLWRKPGKLDNGASEPPVDIGELPSAV